ADPEEGTCRRRGGGEDEDVGPIAPHLMDPAPGQPDRSGDADVAMAGRSRQLCGGDGLQARQRGLGSHVLILFFTIGESQGSLSDPFPWKLWIPGSVRS